MLILLILLRLRYPLPQQQQPGSCIILFKSIQSCLIGIRKHFRCRRSVYCLEPRREQTQYTHLLSTGIGFEEGMSHVYDLKTLIFPRQAEGILSAEGHSYPGLEPRRSPLCLLPLPDHGFRLSGRESLTSPIVNKVIFHLISSHFVSSRLISSHIMSSHLILSHLILSHIVSSHIISSHLVSYHLISTMLTLVIPGISRWWLRGYQVNSRPKVPQQ